MRGPVETRVSGSRLRISGRLCRAGWVGPPAAASCKRLLTLDKSRKRVTCASSRRTGTGSWPSPGPSAQAYGS